jgi:hypothetical protein
LTGFFVLTRRDDLPDDTYFDDDDDDNDLDGDELDRAKGTKGVKKRGALNNATSAAAAKKRIKADAT